ncbi:larval cuticle protein 65Ag1-like isoform X2 [Amphibalanus amphitrite]|uniref:larval cuticle protein 65Ag1-like isoform X2 n=1 Tax=Amphibalanus amphitrite TaxID=1232801 RepID=UPI001C8FB2E8|nr:larval cuticle protein 65Ag1-like isoform X2 [Amphibalanus amphitrite]XP_043231125.1 larval cuticle protein 65Ag1-like isoform X2 [Amphibalanus amphitrite]
MKLVILLSVVALAAAAPQDLVESEEPEIRILNQYYNQDGKGNYEYGYEQDNGQKVEEVGRSYPGDEPETGSISKEGSFEFFAPNQQKYRVDYLADEGGFQPEGEHLPRKPDQIPEYAALRQAHPELFVGAFWLNN